jgi:hypothetical protein
VANCLLVWGQGRVKQLLALWQERRAARKIRTIEARLVNFSTRIGRLKPSEAKIVKQALLRIASIAAIDQPQFEDLAGAVLTAWEGGRLRDNGEAMTPPGQCDRPRQARGHGGAKA